MRRVSVLYVFWRAESKRFFAASRDRRGTHDAMRRPTAALSAALQGGVSLKV
jgi:hypothetical protein